MRTNIIFDMAEVQDYIKQVVNRHGLVRNDCNYSSTFASQKLIQYLVYSCLLKEPEHYNLYLEDCLGEDFVREFDHIEQASTAYNLVLRSLTFLFPHFKAHKHNVFDWVEIQIHINPATDVVVFTLVCNDFWLTEVGSQS